MTETRSARRFPWLGFVAGLALGVVVVVGRARPRVVSVEGRSMSPALEPGSRVLVLRMAPKRGVVVVAEHPSRHMEIIKRVVAGPGDTVAYGPEDIVLREDEWWLEGDQEEWSTDSRRFGPLPRAAIQGRAFALRPAR